MIIISDTTPILSLLKAGRLELLERLYQNVIMPEAVYVELTNNTAYEEERREIENCPFLSVEKVHSVESVRILRNTTGLDAGESESLILYEEKKADLLLIDEHKGRSVAKRMSVKHVGTVGILIQAFDEGILAAEEVQESLEVMITCNIRLSRELCNKVLRYVGAKKYF